MGKLSDNLKKDRLFVSGSIIGPKRWYAKRNPIHEPIRWLRKLASWTECRCPFERWARRVTFAPRSRQSSRCWPARRKPLWSVQTWKRLSRKNPTCHPASSLLMALSTELKTRPSLALPTLRPSTDTTKRHFLHRCLRKSSPTILLTRNHRPTYRPEWAIRSEILFLSHRHLPLINGMLVRNFQSNTTLKVDHPKTLPVTVQSGSTASSKLVHNDSSLKKPSSTLPGPVSDGIENSFLFLFFFNHRHLPYADVTFLHNYQTHSTLRVIDIAEMLAVTAQGGSTVPPNFGHIDPSHKKPSPNLPARVNDPFGNSFLPVALGLYWRKFAHNYQTSARLNAVNQLKTRAATVQSGSTAPSKLLPTNESSLKRPSPYLPKQSSDRVGSIFFSPSSLAFFIDASLPAIIRATRRRKPSTNWKFFRQHWRRRNTLSVPYACGYSMPRLFSIAETNIFVWVLDSQKFTSKKKRKQHVDMHHQNVSKDCSFCAKVNT